MEYKIVADSSADQIKTKKIPTAIAALKIITKDFEYTDNSELDVEKMVTTLKNYNGRLSTSCPSMLDWLETFGDSKYVFCVTITSKLSGSYNSACLAKDEYETTYPDRKVYIIDSLATGPSMLLIIEKLEALILENKNFEDICKEITEYKKNLGLVFMLQSLKNLANNGRVSQTVAKLSGVLGIRVIGKASKEGELEVVEKSRGETKAIASIIKYMEKLDFKGKKVRISHCMNLPLAKKVYDIIKEKYKDCDIVIQQARGLCSFYAEKGGIIIGFENG